tara:strand:+ start:1389 stop:1622 length:234 start_codon:yes stop_codon:yes gene_type:complete
MPSSKKTTRAKKNEPKKEPKKEAPAPKKETPQPKAAAPLTLGELKKKFVADRKASPKNEKALRAEYLKNKKAIQDSL